MTWLRSQEDNIHVRLCQVCRSDCLNYALIILFACFSELDINIALVVNWFKYLQGATNFSRFWNLIILSDLIKKGHRGNSTAQEPKPLKLIRTLQVKTDINGLIRLILRLILSINIYKSLRSLNEDKFILESANMVSSILITSISSYTWFYVLRSKK